MSSCVVPAVRLPVARSVLRSSQFCLTDLLLGITIVWIAIPETLSENIYIYDVPLHFVIFYTGVTSCLLSSLFRGISHISLFLRLALVGLLCMAVFGFCRGNDLKFWVIDVSNYAGLLLGLYWADRYPLAHTLNTLYWWTMAITVVLLLNIVGLLTGIVPQANEGDRLYSYSLFSSTLFVACMFPLWISIGKNLNPRFFAIRGRTLAILGISCVGAASIVSATRSMFLVVVAATVISMWTQLRGKNAPIIVGSTALAGLFLSFYLFNPDNWGNSSVASRLSLTEVKEEYRYLELEMMFEQLEGSFWIGKGFGSQFESCIGGHLGNLAYAPHVGIFASLFKGGLGVFALLIVYPVCSAVIRLIRLSGATAALAFAAAVVVFAVQSSMSGGWSYSDLFLYGMAVSLVERCGRQVGMPPRPLRRLT